ncbi:MAG: divalent-cation tolerance protein CutA [Gemmatimonadota bacterium]
MNEAPTRSRGGPEEPVVALLVTGPDADTLASIGRALVEAGLAACVNVLPGARSLYLWEGRVHEDAEAIGIVKTVRSLVPAVTRRIGELHPYELPEVLGLRAEGGSEAYAAWVRESVAGRTGDESE